MLDSSTINIELSGKKMDDLSEWQGDGVRLNGYQNKTLMLRVPSTGPVAQQRTGSNGWLTLNCWLVDELPRLGSRIDRLPSAAAQINLPWLLSGPIMHAHRCLFHPQIAIHLEIVSSKEEVPGVCFVFGHSITNCVIYCQSIILFSDSIYLAGT
ncbi:Uncharacterized protein HZ326_24102 [Fusarium oxysporum f. sp. albedinis]|nr:Uncharacterized protein HZ326_24102 [Fusarium oxysporum f. sp. albedinis]